MENDDYVWYIKCVRSLFSLECEKSVDCTTLTSTILQCVVSWVVCGKLAGWK